ncbi:hypothetical protein GHT06_013450 [Daphnia sinensis]|uniref:Uncharacterized protein n=1 Tax=Daphnia sinensis TaxID=1820382 RepID=A0AAD5LCL8_9CRUS|nr:hypothetical protein GHT06_013450 [Daphnia sinensis]
MSPLLDASKRGIYLTEQSFEGLKAFARQWSAKHETLENKNSNGVTYLPIYQLVARLSTLHRPGLNKVTIAVFYNFTSFTVKPKNLTAILSDFEKTNVMLKDVSFVSYGNVAKGKGGTVFAPFVVAGDEMSRVIQERQLSDWIKSMKWSR